MRTITSVIVYAIYVTISLKGQHKSKKKIPPLGPPVVDRDETRTVEQKLVPVINAGAAATLLEQRPDKKFRL